MYWAALLHSRPSVTYLQSERSELLLRRGAGLTGRTARGDALACRDSCEAHVVVASSLFRTCGGESLAPALCARRAGRDIEQWLCERAAMGRRARVFNAAWVLERFSFWTFGRPPCIYTVYIVPRTGLAQTCKRTEMLRSGQGGIIVWCLWPRRVA